MAQKQIQCPNCKGFDTTSVSPKYLARIIGLTSLVLGFATLIFIIGIPFILIGIVLLPLSFFLKETNKMRCRTCKLIFFTNSEAKK